MSGTLSVSAFYYTFRDIIRLIHACARVEDIAEIVVVKIARAFEAQGALLQLYHRQTGQSLTRVGHGLGELYQAAGPLTGSEAVLEICAGQKVVVLDALGQDARVLPVESDRASEVQVLVVAPLGLQEELAGIICLIFDHPQDFPPEEVEFLAAVAQQCTCAIDKARLIEKQQQQFDQLAYQTERLTALGRMAAGVAHELNNPLSSILLYSSNMLKKVPADSFLHEGMGIIIQETKRCKTIIQELQDFSRSKEPKKSLGNINTVLEKVIHLLENEFRRRAVRLHQDMGNNLPDMLIDVGQMQQVFANLLINALEAVDGKGEITVRTHFDEAKRAVTITIADTGCGMPPEHLRRIFEPFFSSKAKGTGLGLAVTYGFIMNHQGDIQVESEPQQGTRFTITLPVIGPELEPHRTTP
ncbi:MAG: GAF domain-containing protein [Deltaproteobacteria bacterium]|nr:GAF domain-containing protein [Deltaproteobacteria bacterium]